MSERPMRIPDSVKNKDENQYAELCFFLPPEWDMSREGLEKETNFWALSILKILARFPHDNNIWLGFGHSIPNGEYLTETTQLNAYFLSSSILFQEDFNMLTLNKRKINLYCLVPIYQEELDFKMERGRKALLDKFDEYQTSDVLDLKRINVITGK